MKTRGILKGFLPALFAGMAIVASVWWFISAPNKGVKELPVIQGHREGCMEDASNKIRSDFRLSGFMGIPCHN